VDKNKDKNIEDMTMFIELACTSRELGLEDRQEIAKTLYALGYRKIADGEVVVKADIKCIDSTTAVNVIEFFAKHNAKVRQETATEILQEFKTRIKPIPQNHFTRLEIDWEIAILAQKYGIEL
jgi:hypothetical protein